ncbi:fructosamine kinase family protein [Nocardia sp. NPDC050710]|uniref:fructosamine kinase family protein n=1 Tax=Nocardia sp. NPDC050710 TaxID=3157220 RepID=UPI0033F72232
MSLAIRLGDLLGGTVRGVADLGPSHGWTLHRAILSDGRDVFVKSTADHSAVLAAEANGLRWLGGAVPDVVAPVLAVDDHLLVLPWLPESDPTPSAAERLGRELAALHAKSPGVFGAPWPGWIAELPLDNTETGGGQAGRDHRDDLRSRAAPIGGTGAAILGRTTDHRTERLVTPIGTVGAHPAATQARATPDSPSPDPGWPRWYAERRLAPYLPRAARHLGADGTRLIEQLIDRVETLAGPPEPPARIHGDLWAGNIRWSRDHARLIDPAAHGGHRETDLAMLALFGAPHLDRMLAAYREIRPLAEGWRERLPLHQLHPLLVHVVLFGDSYRDRTLAAATAALSA